MPPLHGSSTMCEGRKRQPVPTSWLDSRCNSLSSCRPGITRRCNTPPLSLLMNNRTGEIVCDARALRCKDLRLDSRYKILFRSHYMYRYEKRSAQIFPECFVAETESELISRNGHTHTHTRTSEDRLNLWTLLYKNNWHFCVNKFN